MTVFTEEEAKDKLCCGPSGCGLISDIRSDDGMSLVFAGVRICVGSRCAAWRWIAGLSIEQSSTPDKFFAADEKQGALMVPEPPQGSGWQMVQNPKDLPGWHTWQRFNTTSQSKGYCGLAGEPKVW